MNPVRYLCQYDFLANLVNFLVPNSKKFREFHLSTLGFAREYVNTQKCSRLVRAWVRGSLYIKAK